MYVSFITMDNSVFYSKFEDIQFSFDKKYFLIPSKMGFHNSLYIDSVKSISFDLNDYDSIGNGKILGNKTIELFKIRNRNIEDYVEKKLDIKEGYYILTLFREGFIKSGGKFN